MNEEQLALNNTAIEMSESAAAEWDVNLCRLIDVPPRGCMALIRPRLTDYYDLALTQTESDFAIPLLDEDIPLHVDPFLLWKSPSLQDNALHTALITAFNNLIQMYRGPKRSKALALVISLSECDEAGLGSSKARTGKRIGHDLANELLGTLADVPQIEASGLRHLEVAQLLVDGIGRDRISDIACSVLKSFLIDYTIEQSRRHGIPLERVTMQEVLDYQTMTMRSESVTLPVSPATKKPVLLIPKRWLRYSPWIGYDTYFEGSFIPGEAPTERPAVLLYNRHNFGIVEAFVSQREAMAAACTNDVLFAPISVLSAKRRLASLRKLASGNKERADRLYEEIVGSLLTSTLHPYLDFAASQVRTESGSQIRDLIFYNSRAWDFLQDLHDLYDSRQLVFELKNVQALQREHVGQLNRYLTEQFGRFGVLVTRTAPEPSLQKNLVDLWSGQRRCILVLTDIDIELMVTLFESHQRLPIEVLKKSYVDFSRLLPS